MPALDITKMQTTATKLACARSGNRGTAEEEEVWRVWRRTFDLVQALHLLVRGGQL